jgi:hypothetical protein
MDFTKALTYVGLKVGNQRIKVNILAFLERLENPADINEMIDEFSLLLFPVEITENQKKYLKELLIPGLPDYEWGVEYWNYKDNLDDENLVNSMENKLKYFLNSLLTMPEFYLS